MASATGTARGNGSKSRCPVCFCGAEFSNAEAFSPLCGRSPFPAARRTSRIAAALAIAGVAVVVLTLLRLPADYDQAVAQSRKLSQSGNVLEALHQALSAAEASPERPEAWLVAAGAAAKLCDVETAVKCYDRLSTLSGSSSFADLRSARLLTDSGRLSEAELRLRRLLEHSPGNQEALRLLSTLLLSEGRHWEARPVLLDLVRSGRFHADELIMLGSLRETLEDEPLLEKAQSAAPEDAGPLIGLARLAEARDRPEQGLSLYQQARRLDPNQSEASAGIGRIHAQSRNWEALKQWSEQLPPAAAQHPDVWWSRSQLAASTGDAAAAAADLSQVLERNPNHRGACYQLGQILLTAGHAEIAEAYLTRAQRLEELEQVLHLYLFGEHTAARAMRASQLTSQLGRHWEAWAWRSLAAGAVAAEPGEFSRLQTRAQSTQAQTEADVLPAVPLDLLTSRSPTTTQTALDQPRSAGSVCFRDDGQAAGLDFSPYAGYDGQPSGLWIYQNFGGGVAVIDYDNDLWPDLYFVQGNEHPRGALRDEYRNVLFRNLGGERFVAVAEASRAGDTGFGQGVAVGDLDADGFCDLYVANIGQNRLLRNNGDGTFTDVSSRSLPPAEEWTTSCLMADLDGDGFEELYDVNYLAGSEPYTRMCGKLPERMRSCKPDLFEAAEDRLLRNLGTGRFDDISSGSDGSLRGGKGLGAIAADLDGSGTLDIFVANDTTANFLLLNEGRGGSLRLRDAAVLLGCAFNDVGVREACMGVALSDFDGDELPDLFVTNFIEETNTLYSWREGVFVDKTVTADLAEPSRKLLGFGTQAIDGQLDGLPDLFVANGHIDDFRHDGAPWKMAPQYFINVGNGRFQLADVSLAGEYFGSEMLGRAVARLDWNGDLRDDLVVTHLDRPPALLTNHTTDVGNAIGLRLVGVNSNRMATGATVRVVGQSRIWLHYLPAGGGYFASNQHALTIGLGDEPMAERIEVRWPSGETQQFGPVAADRRLLIIEGRDEPLDLPK